MIPVRKTIHRNITIAFIALICLIQISVPLYHAQALSPLPVIDAAVVNTTLATQVAVNALTAEYAATEATKAALLAAIEAAKAAKIVADDARSFLEKYVIYPAIRVLIMTLIQSLSNDIVGWIKGDGGSNVGFVKNLEQNAVNEANQQAGEFLNHVSGIDLCSLDIGKLIKIQVNTPGYQHLNAQLACTLTGIVDNVESFYQDFNNGGWPAFVGIAVDSQNNAIGASMIAEVNFQARKNSAAEALQNRLNRGSGFKGVTLKKKSLVCDAIKDPLIDTPVEHCYTQEVDTTPGGVVADALNTQLNHVGVDMGIAELGAISNAVDGAISAIITALTQRIFKEATSLF